MWDLYTGATVMILSNYVLYQCLMNGWVGCVQNIYFCSSTKPWVSSSLPAYIVVDLPKCLIRMDQKFFHDKPRTCAPMHMAKFECENYCCLESIIPLRVCKKIDMHKPQGVSIGLGKSWDTWLSILLPITGILGQIWILLNFPGMPQSNHFPYGMMKSMV